MSKINVTRPHSLPTEEIKKRLNDFQGQLKSDYGVEGTWVSDNKATVAGKGLKSGEVSFDDKSVTVDLKLGMFLRPLKGKIESKITSELEKLVQG